MKLCIDKQCKRSGKKLSVSAFPKNRKRKDGLNPYCKECSTRRIHEYRDRKRAYKKARRLGQFRIERKPMAVSLATRSTVDQVKDAVHQGLRTREQIQKSTRLSYDEIGDALAELWDQSAVRIVRVGEGREFHRAA